MVSVRFADVADVLVIAVLMYVVLSWLRRRGSHAAALTLLLLAGLYALAHLLNMYLTLMFFRVGLTALVLALLLAFQGDIRRGLERLVASPWIQGQAPAVHPRSHDAIVETAARLAEQHIGALVVVAGREPLDRHLRGGVSLDGVLSVPLLHSLFHPESGGHDGAVVIEKDRVSRFAVHLPLSTNFNQLNGTGTRHAAALGLSERCDALLIVVSEERGTIAVAENAKMTHGVSPGELAGWLQRHLALSDDRPEPRGIGHFLFRDLAWKSLSLLLAFGLWFLLAYQADIVQRVFVNVPVEYRNLPPHWSVVDFAPENVRITLTGRERAFTEFDFRRLIVSLDLANIREGQQQIPVADEMLDLPDDILMRQTDRPVITLTAYEMAVVSLPVKVNFQPLDGPLPRVRSEPREVRLLVRRMDRERWLSVPTETIDPKKVRLADGALEVSLAPPAEARLAEGTQPTVRIYRLESERGAAE
jgi:diadenylate cyclase